jgi:hypothetical protein
MRKSYANRKPVPSLYYLEKDSRYSDGMIIVGLYLKLCHEICHEKNI